MCVYVIRAIKHIYTGMKACFVIKSAVIVVNAHYYTTIASCFKTYRKDVVISIVDSSLQSNLIYDMKPQVLIINCSNVAFNW